MNRSRLYRDYLLEPPSIVRSFARYPQPLPSDCVPLVGVEHGRNFGEVVCDRHEIDLSGTISSYVAALNLRIRFDVNAHISYTFRFLTFTILDTRAVFGPSCPYLTRSFVSDTHNVLPDLCLRSGKSLHGSSPRPVLGWYSARTLHVCAMMKTRFCACMFRSCS